MQRFAVYFLFLFAACTQSGLSQSTITADDLQKMVKEDATIQLVDLRTPGELAQTGKIEGALPINFNSPDFQQQISKLDKTKPVIIYCAAGGRSTKATPLMTQMGFSKVYNYTGGMNDWKAKGLKTVQ